MNRYLFKERKFFQLEFLKNTIEMISKGCKFHVIGNHVYLYNNFTTLWIMKV